MLSNRVDYLILELQLSKGREQYLADQILELRKRFKG
jgi:hypothetical protein